MPLPVVDMVTIAQRIADRWSAIPGVRAVALGGSLGRAAIGWPDMVLGPPGDIDLYVYADNLPDPAKRLAAINDLGGQEIELNRQFWETDDGWIDGVSGVLIEAMHRSTTWIADDLDRVLTRHQASIGYTTSLADSVRDSVALADPTGWFADLQEVARRPYPRELRDAIIAKNRPILRSTHASYHDQIASAVRRDDLNSVAHRTTALLASFWDILFAINLAFHPGEKRLVAFAEIRCPNRPADLGEKIHDIVTAVGKPEGVFLRLIDGLLDDLDVCIAQVPDSELAG